MLGEQLTLLIFSCEKYMDLWDDHIRLLHQNWPDRTAEVLLVTDVPTDRQYDGVRILAAGKEAEFTDKLSKALQETKTEFILMLLDDYYPIYPIETEKLHRLLACMQKERLDFLSLYANRKGKVKIDGYSSLFHADFSKSKYVVNLFPGIWRRSFLDATLGETRNIWQYEVSLTPLALKIGARCAMSHGHEYDVLNVVCKGKLLRKAARYLKKHDLYHGDRPVLPFAEEFRFHFFNTLKGVLPLWLIRLLKRIGSKCGMTFYSGVD